MFKNVPPTALQKFVLTSSGYRQKSAQTIETEELKESMKQYKTAHGQIRVKKAKMGLHGERGKQAKAVLEKSVPL